MPDVFCPACAFRGALAVGNGVGTGEGIWFMRWLRRLQIRKQAGKSQQIVIASAVEKDKECLPMTPVAPAPGDIIEDYEILEKIGGNMGLVYRARHLLLDKVVALKLLPAEWIADSARLARFEREIRVMGQFEHPNLVTAADARRLDSWHLVAMEWIDGVDLQQLVRTQGAFPVAAACEAARQAAQGLQHGHEHGLIHRDIKPSNLMLTRAGILKVIDMGLALIREDSTAQLTQTGLVLGTMSYCAPEQFRDASHVDIRADIYSLGCTLFHLLTGKSPYWQRKTFAEVMQAHLQEPFPSLTDALPDAPAGLEAVLARMTAKARDARFSTPSEVVEALEPFARGADLRPLVPAKIQQDAPARAAAGKTAPTPEGRRPGASGEQQPKPRWTRRDALLVLLPAITGAAVLFMNRRKSDSVGTKSNAGVPEPDSVHPVVYLMDTTAPGGVYDPEKVGPGGSNTTAVRDALQDLGLLPLLRLELEPVNLEWGGHHRVRSRRPDLVIIHRSSFYHPVNTYLQLGRPPFESLAEEEKFDAVYRLADDKLIDFMGYVASHVPRTRFLVYSRGTDPKWKDDDWRTSTWTKSAEARHPELKSRIRTMVIPGDYHGSFKDPKARELLGKMVREILQLPEETK